MQTRFTNFLSIPNTLIFSRKSFEFISVTSREHGIVRPNDVQKEVIPAIMSNQNVVFSSQTGTGKTLAYLLPLLQRVKESPLPFQVLILLPSRELAVQVMMEVYRLENQAKKPLDESVRRLIDLDPLGTSEISVDNYMFNPQLIQLIYAFEDPMDALSQLLSTPPKILLATPSACLGLLKAPLGVSLLPNVTTLVLDEGDRTLKPLKTHATYRELLIRKAHPRDGAEIIRLLRKRRTPLQLICASATVSNPLKAELSRLGFLDILYLRIGAVYQVPKHISHQYIIENQHFLEKAQIVSKLLKDRPLLFPALIILKSGQSSDLMIKNLEKHNISAVTLHSQLHSLQSRQQLLQDFESKRIQAVISIEDSARGLDFTFLSTVILMGAPTDPNSYLHMAGRAGRRGQTSQVISVVSSREFLHLKMLRTYLGIRFECLVKYSLPSPEDLSIDPQKGLWEEEENKMNSQEEEEDEEDEEESEEGHQKTE